MHDPTHAVCVYCRNEITRAHPRSGVWQLAPQPMSERVKRGRGVPPHARVETTRDTRTNEER